MLGSTNRLGVNTSLLSWARSSHRFASVSSLGTKATSSGNGKSKERTYSLDGTLSIEDDNDYYGSSYRRGMGGHRIRASWEQTPKKKPFSSSSALDSKKIVSGSANTTPEAEPVSSTPMFLNVPKTVKLLGVPLSWGQPMAGTDSGPALLRGAGIKRVLTRLGWRVEDLHDVKVDAPTSEDSVREAAYTKSTGWLALNSCAVGRANHLLSQSVAASCKAGHFSLVMGGDHSLGLGSIFGVLSARPNVGVIWVDAHADLNTPQMSETGNMHGMPLGLLMAPDEVRCAVPGFEWMRGGPRLDPSRLVYIGARDLDTLERKVIRAKSIKTFTMFEVDKYGIGEVVRRALAHLGPDTPIHLSYDIDAVDPEYAPSTGTVVRGGFNYREAHYISEAVAETNRLASLDIVEINADLSAKDSTKDNPTVQLGLALVASAMGQRIL